MILLIVVLLTCRYLEDVTSKNVHLSKSTKVITTTEIPCLSLEISNKAYIAKTTRPIEVQIDLGVNVAEVRFMDRRTDK